MLHCHGKSSLLLLICCLGFSYLSLVSARVLVRPSISTLAPQDTGLTSNQYEHDLLDRRDNPISTPNTSFTDQQVYDNVLSFVAQKRLHRRAGKQPPPATDSELRDSAAKGCNLLYMLAANADDALTRLKTNPKLSGLKTSQSPWDNAGALKTYGWTEKKDNVNWAYMGINDVMKELGVDTASKDNMNIQLLQDTAVTVDGVKYAASQGTYDQAINPSAGLIIPYYVYSPRHETISKGVKGALVPFQQYSDVLFLEYSKLCNRAKPKADLSALKHVLFINIENPQTWAMALKVLMNKNKGSKDLPLWPGMEVGLNEVEGKALLGTQIGAPVAWMLAQHKQAFGARSVVKMRVFRNMGMTNRDTDQPYPSILFYIGDAPGLAKNHCDPEDTCCCPRV